MPFTENDLREFLFRLQSDPDARRELRDLVREPALERVESTLAELAAADQRTAERLAALSDHVDRQGQMLTARVDQLAEQMRALTARVDQLAEQMQALTARVDQLTARVDQLAEQLQALTARVDQLTARVDQLTARVDQLTARVDQLTARVDRLIEQMQALTGQVAHLVAAQRQTEANLARLADRVGGLLGESLERRYRERAGAYFGRVLRRTRVLDVSALEDALEERLSPDEMHDTLLTDAVVSGKPLARPDVEEVWLAVEVSSVVDPDDVSRAVRRSRLLSRSGRPAVPVVAGEAITTGADEAARRENVAVVEDGRISNWDGALEAAVGAA